MASAINDGNGAGLAGVVRRAATAEQILGIKCRTVSRQTPGLPKRPKVFVHGSPEEIAYDKQARLEAKIIATRALRCGVMATASEVMAS